MTLLKIILGKALFGNFTALRIVVVTVGLGRLEVGVSDMNNVLLRLLDCVVLELFSGMGVRVTGGRLITEKLVTRLLAFGVVSLTFLIRSGVEKSEVISLNRADSALATGFLTCCLGNTTVVVFGDGIVAAGRCCCTNLNVGALILLGS